MSEDIERLRSRKCSEHLDESALRDREVVLLTYARYCDKDNFAEEMLFCKPLESTVTSKDGASIMTRKKNGCLKWMENEKRRMFLVQCVIQRQTLVAKNISPVLNEILNLII
ncbi:SCAN domain-containing protein 3 [Trichonephila clavata]|uniref:SCAN domain-containing protein 3 n=1 Tax=Trichonephila clavata TaxID=2740835 RepID=A0A8X6GR10_TRICU|nr:SCAN domain-containing protein 3 [Trichonephila clavata]